MFFPDFSESSEFRLRAIIYKLCQEQVHTNAAYVNLHRNLNHGEELTEQWTLSVYKYFSCSSGVENIKSNTSRKLRILDDTHVARL